MWLFSNRYLNIAAWAVLISAVAAIAAGVGVAGVVVGLVFFGDKSHLERSTLLARINEETTIMCLDEQTPIGSFFNSEHRRYVKIDEIPDHMINAIIAAEDKNFYSHKGVDPSAIFKAVLEGFKTGRFRGGSTLTQQTVKNIMDDWEYSIRRKIKEATAALQIERMYTKREILEFYLNQFHVSGNGTGIGIAAKHYFNKEVKDLDLVESAFIAGSVKGPSKYDPFLKYTKESREKAVREAFVRKNYVINRMFEQGWITKELHDDALKKPVPFNRGSFGSSEVALVTLVKSQLARREILDALKIDTVEDLTRAGFKVYTTIDCKLQADAQLAMRRNLSRLETILGGFQPENPESFKRLRDLNLNGFYFGKVEEVHKDDKNPSIKISFGLSTGVIPAEAIKRYAMLMDMPFWEGYQAQTKRLLNAIKKGDTLFVEVKEYDEKKHEAVLELHKRPKINGGLVALDKGEVRVAVSGFDTLGFNRAIYARRQPGSVFKSVVYFAAMQLGWNVLDVLDNERQLFPYQGKFYFPRGDHVSPYRKVSMIYAGTMSENLASVSLTYKLVDKLNLEQFKQLMGVMDLLPHSGESVPDFHYRVAKFLGVQLDNEGVREFQLRNAVQDIMPDLIFSGQQSAIRAMEKIWWGKGYVGELQRVYQESGKDMPPPEQAVRIELLRNNFLRLQEMARKVEADWQLIANRVNEKGPEAALTDPAILPILERFKVLPTSGSKPALGYFGLPDGEPSTKGNEHLEYIERLVGVQGRSLNALDAQNIWGALGGGAVQLSEVRLNGNIPIGSFNRLREAVDSRYDQIMHTQTEYDLNKYFQHHDLRVAVGLNYLVHITKAMGVSSPLEPVLSYPLGTNVVTAGEIAKIYQTFVDGKIYKFYDQGAENQLNFIRRIDSRDGKSLYEPKMQETVVTLPEYSSQMREILRRVVTHGTGRSRRGELYVSLGEQPDPKGGKNAKPLTVRVPAFGKTGTTNDYHNAYFAGFFPFPTVKGQPLEFANSFAIASYVGYDISKIMRRGSIKISGALGGLPTWTDFAKAMIEEKKYVDFVDPLDLTTIKRGEWPMAYKDNLAANVAVDLPRGVLLNGGGDDEQYGVTNIEKSGETYENEFAVGNTLNVVLRVPPDGKGGVARVFSPLKLPDQQGIEVSPSKIEVAQPVPVEPIDNQAATPKQAPADSKVVIPAGGEKAPTSNVLDILDDEGKIIKQDETPKENAPAAAPKKDDGFIEEELW